jgi:hypothetical protein
MVWREGSFIVYKEENGRVECLGNSSAMHPSRVLLTEPPQTGQERRVQARKRWDPTSFRDREWERTAIQCRERERKKSYNKQQKKHFCVFFCQYLPSHVMSRVMILFVLSCAVLSCLVLACHIFFLSIGSSIFTYVGNYVLALVCCCWSCGSRLETTKHQAPQVKTPNWVAPHDDMTHERIECRITYRKYQVLFKLLF